MLSPGAEAQSGLNAWLLGIVAFYADYLNPIDPLPVYFLAIRHWTLDMVRLEHNAVSIAHIDNHILAVRGDARLTSQKKPTPASPLLATDPTPPGGLLSTCQHF